MKQLIGTGVALVTPFKEDLSVDVEAFKRIIDYCIDGGVEYLVVLGTTGESVTLGKEEKQLIMETAVTHNAGRVPLVVGIGGNNTASLTNELRNSDLEHFDAVLSVSPYYNKPTQEGIYRHFKALSQASPKPIILYNVPARTGSNMLPQTVIRLAKECDNIVAIKEASGDLEQIDLLLNQKPRDFLVISGDDFTALPTILAGGAGVISVLGQGLPSAFSKMILLGLRGDAKEAQKIHNELRPGMDLIFQEGNPAGIKAVLEVFGHCKAWVRLPLVEASDHLKAKISTFIKSLTGVYA